MSRKTICRHEVAFAAGAASRPRVQRAAMTLVAGTVALIALAGLTGCEPEDKEIPAAKVETVKAYGLTLDESATPQEVAYVLLRSLADDVRAAQTHQHEDQKAANRLTFSLAAYDLIAQRLLNTLNRTRTKNHKMASLGDRRDKRLFEIVDNWAPIVAHYVRSFDTDRDAALKKLVLQMTPDGKTAHVYYDVSHDPAETNPAKQQVATIDIELAKVTAGAKSYWRVARLSFLGKADRARLRAKTRPAASEPV